MSLGVIAALASVFGLGVLIGAIMRSLTALVFPIGLAAILLIAGFLFGVGSNPRNDFGDALLLLLAAVVLPGALGVIVGIFGARRLVNP